MTVADYRVGVDLGGTNVRAAVVDERGKIRAAARAPLTEDHSPEAVVALTRETIAGALADAQLSLSALLGVGVGVAGQLRGASGVVANGPNLGWREVPFGRMLSAALARPVRVVNDLEAIAWGEFCFGAARGEKDVLVVCVGTGVGAGLIVDGRLYHGATGVAAEIGHVKVRFGGEPCGCGKRGCLEAYLGGGNLNKRLQRETYNWPALLQKTAHDPVRVHPGLVEELVEEGDARARGLWDELAQLLGMVLANAVTMINPALLVLGGTVLKGCPSLQARAEKIFRELVLEIAGEAVSIKPTALGDDGGILGAAALGAPRS
jgi:Transcriptional regulator/sugar kinase